MRLVEYAPFVGFLVVVVVVFRVRNPDRIKIEFLKLGSVEISRSKPDDPTPPSPPTSSA